MTYFVKEDFRWDGMYLMYQGKFEGSRTMEEVSPNCHPSWHGMPERTFIARFKYGSKPWKSWMNYLVKHCTVEQYIELTRKTSPMEAMESIGFKPRKKRAAPQRTENGFNIQGMT